MIFLSTYRVIKFAFQNTWRNFWLSFITLSMLTLTLVSVSMLLLVNVITNQSINYVEDRVEVSIYLQPSISDERLASTTGYLQTLPQVRDVSVITREEAYDRFVTRHKNDSDILASLEEVNDNPFGPTLVVRAHKSEDFAFIIQALDNPQFRDYVRDKDMTDYTKIIDRMKEITDRVRLAALALSVIFLCIALIVVFNTVRMGIFIHREEIGIMKLVGATNRFVRAPFFLEAIGVSAVAVGVVTLLSVPILQILDVRLTSFFDGYSLGLSDMFFANIWMILGIELISLSVITLISTWFAMRKYLRV